MTPPVVVLERVRQALAEAEVEGRPAPGRPTLIRRTGARENQVREALGIIRQQRASAAEDLASAGDELAPVTEPAGSAPGLMVNLGQQGPATRAPEIHQQWAWPGADGPLVPVGEPAGNVAPAVTARAPRAWPLAVIALAAAVAVWSGWVGLGELAGFGVVRLLPGLWDGLRLNTAVVLPLSVECYGAYALRCWLGSSLLSERTRRFAKRLAVTSLVIGAGAQVAYHLLVAAGVRQAPWPVVVLVSCVPVVVLGLASALARLVTSDHQPAASTPPPCGGNYGR